MVSVGIIGGGSWATAQVKIFSENEEIRIHWWLHKEDDVNYILKYKHNPKYLSDVEIDLKKVIPTHDIRKCIVESDILILAVPSAFVTEVLEPVQMEWLKNKIVVSAVKGMIQETHQTITQYIHSVYDVPKENLAVIGGPCHAEEVAMEKQAYLTVGGGSEVTANKVAELLNGRFIKAKPSSDVEGIEYAAVIKNILAIACGIAHGLGYGDNFQSVLVANAIQEMTDFIRAESDKPRNIIDSVYVGDLLVTAYSQFSRNRMFGNMVGRGYSVKSAQMEMNMVAEGYYAVKSINEVNKKLKVEMPITSTVYHILYDRNSAIMEMRILKDRLS